MQVLKELLTEKKAAQTTYFKYKDETNDLKNYMTKIRESISEFTNLTAEESLQVQPIIDAKKNDVDGKIAVIKEKIAELNKKFDEDKEKYVAQQDLIQKIDYMKKEYYFIFFDANL